MNTPENCCTRALITRHQRHLQAETVSFSADAAGNVSRVNLNDGRGIAAERVVLSVGVRPNIALAQRSGLPCDRGILVNPQLQTADPHISAIGECCQWGELTFGWWPRAGSRLKRWPRGWRGRQSHFIRGAECPAAPQGHRPEFVLRR
ncbi:FAD-dependent oxidoreductase [Serratia ureilytica]